MVRSLRTKQHSQKTIGEIKDEAIDTVKSREAPNMLENIAMIFEKQYKEFSQTLEDERNSFSQTLEEAVKKLYFKGMSVTEIADCLDLSLEKVAEIIRSLS